MTCIRTRVRPLILAGALALAVASCSGTGGSAEGGAGTDDADELAGTVTLLLPNTTTTRFVEHDAPAFVDAMKELAPGVDVEIINAEGDAAKQISQAETAIVNGTSAIVLVAADPALSGTVLEQAAASEIPVVGYEHEALDGPVAYQVINDPLKVGEAQGKYFVENLPESDGPVSVARVYGNKGDNYTIKVEEGQNEHLTDLIDSGAIEVVCEDYAEGWNPANAQQLIEQCLTKTSNQIDAILVSNDGTAQGAIAALEGQQLAGEIPVYGGQDANLEAIKFILQGLQVSTVYKPYNVEGRAAAELVVATLLDEEPPAGLVNGVFDNGFAEIPTAYLDVVSIDVNNLQELVDGGLYTKEEMCEGITTDANFCA